jgi:hypothetical protein
MIDGNFGFKGDSAMFAIRQIDFHTSIRQIT